MEPDGNGLMPDGLSHPDLDLRYPADEMNDDERQRESELTEPPENHCLVCGRRIGWPWDVWSAIRCPNCGADNSQQPPLHPVDIPKLQATIRIREERSR